MPKKERLIVEERIEKFAHDPLCESMNKSYTNQFAVSGWVISKPKLFVTASNLKGVGFIVYQINYRNDGETVYYSTFGIVSYNTDVVAQLEKEEKTYYRDVSIINFDKTEKAGKWLACAVEFAGLSLWYEQDETILVSSKDRKYVSRA